MMRFKMQQIIHLGLILLLIYGGTALVWAEASPTPTSRRGPAVTPGPTYRTEATVTPKRVAITPADIRLAEAISKAYHTSITGQDIAKLRINQNLGYGEIGMLYGLANASGKSITDILAMRQNDIGWGDIAKSLGVKVSDMMSKNTSLLKAAKMNDEAQKLNGKLNNEKKNPTSTPKPTKAAPGNSNPNAPTKHNEGNGKKK